MMKSLAKLKTVWKDAIDEHQVFPSPVEWARKNRIMSVDESPFPGPYDCEPYLVEPQEAASLMDSCDVVVWLAGSQCGKTTGLQNVLGHMITQSPGPSLWVVPNDKDLEKTRANKLDPFISSTPILRNRLAAERASKKQRDNAVMLTYPGGILKLSGSRGKSTYRQDSARLVLLDDADAFSRHPEGDHIELAKSRTRIYTGRGGKVIIVSKPDVSTASITLKAYKSSSRAIYKVPCPHCGSFFVLWRDYFRFSNEKQRPCFECPSCSRAIYEQAKSQMVRDGHWEHRRPNYQWATKGYHFWAAYTPRRYRSWDNMAAALRDANARQALGDQIAKQTVLGEDWAIAWVPESETRLDEQEKRIFRRRETPFKNRIKPNAITVSGTDVQHDRLEIAIWKFGYKLEGWLWHHAVIHGAPEKERSWDRWADMLLAHDVISACVDAKYQMDVVLDAMTERVPQLLIDGCATYATVGTEQNGPLWPGPIEPGNPKDGRVHPVSIRVNTGKDWLYGILKNIEAPGPGFLHFDTKVTRKLLKQLFAEQPVTTAGKKTRYEKRPGRTRNELLDLTVMAKAAVDARCAWDDDVLNFVYGGEFITPQAANEMSYSDDPDDGVF
jgi:phage terminase large subunit GpA-like protein